MMKLFCRNSTCRAALVALCCAAGLPATTFAQAVVGPQNTAPPAASAQNTNFSQFGPQPVTHQVSSPLERIEMIVNTSRVLTLGQRIPRVTINNPEVLGVTPLSENQLQIAAKRNGVTQVNIWDEQNNVHVVDVMVYGDVQELARILQAQFPRAALRLTPISTGVLIQGYVDDPNVQSSVMQIAQGYYPNVINAITIGGVQQVQLQVRVLEVSRTKLQSLGIDMAAILENGSFFATGAAGLLRTAPLTTAGSAATTGSEVITGRIANNGDNFFLFVEALKRNNLAKILSDPALTTVSGRPAFMNSGGEIPIIVPQSLGTVSIEYRRYGTQVDFVPIVLGNGIIRLEVRPRISEIDSSRSVTINGTQVPAMLVREADTAAELRAGQTLAIAGLVQTRIETATRGVPWLMDTPYVGTFFRRTSDQINEVELLIMVTPQIVEGLDPQDLCQLGPGPGTMTTNPGDWQLMQEGHIEVPPSRSRPAHFQQPYPVGAGGAADYTSGATMAPGPGSMQMPSAPPIEALPSVPRTTPVPAPAPRPATPSPSAAPRPVTTPTPQTTTSRNPGPAVATSSAAVRQPPTPQRQSIPATTSVTQPATPTVRPAVRSQNVGSNSPPASVETRTLRVATPTSTTTQGPSVSNTPNATNGLPAMIGPTGYGEIK